MTMKKFGTIVTFKKDHFHDIGLVHHPVKIRAGERGVVTKSNPNVFEITMENRHPDLIDWHNIIEFHLTEYSVAEIEELFKP